MASFTEQSTTAAVSSIDQLAWPLTCLCQEHGSWEEALQACQTLPESADVLDVSGSITRARDDQLVQDLSALGESKTDLHALVANTRLAVATNPQQVMSTRYSRSLVAGGDAFALGLLIAQSKLGASAESMRWPAASSDAGLVAFCFYDSRTCKWYSVVIDTSLPVLSIPQSNSTLDILTSSADKNQDDTVSLLHKALMAWQPSQSWTVRQIIIALTGAIVKTKSISPKTDLTAMLQQAPSSCYVALPVGESPLLSKTNSRVSTICLDDKDGNSSVRLDTLSLMSEHNEAVESTAGDSAQDLVDGIDSLSLAEASQELIGLGYERVEVLYLIGRCPQNSQSHNGVFFRASRDSGDVPSDSEDEDSDAEYEDSPQYVVTTLAEAQEEEETLVVAEMHVLDWASGGVDGQTVAAPRIGLDVFGMEAEDYEMCDDPRALWGPLTRCAFAPPTSKRRISVTFTVKDSWVYTLVPFSSIGNMSFVMRFASAVPVAVHDIVKDAEYYAESSSSDDDDDDNDDDYDEEEDDEKIEE